MALHAKNAVNLTERHKHHFVRPAEINGNRIINRVTHEGFGQFSEHLAKASDNPSNIPLAKANDNEFLSRDAIFCVSDRNA